MMKQGHLKPDMWDSHMERPLRAQTANASTSPALDLFLQCCCWEGFDHLLGWHLHLLAENVPHACFGGWLGPGLDPAQAWNCKDTRFLNLIRGNGHKIVDHLGTSLGFQIVFTGDRFQQSSLCHGFCSSGLHHG